MNQQELAALCQTTIQIVKETADFLRAELGKVKASAIESKSLNSLVSYVDKTAEKHSERFTSYTTPNTVSSWCCKATLTANMGT